MADNPYAVSDADRDYVIAHADVDTRARFIMRTYGHVAGSILAFVLLELIYFNTAIGQRMLLAVLGLPWMVILGSFLVVGWGATHVAHTARSKGAQYAALGAYILVESIIFLPLLIYAAAMAEDLSIITSAAAVTLIGFGALTAIAFLTRKDFSWLRGLLVFGGIMALIGIVGSLIFGFTLGIWFSVAMVALAGGAILYDTSNIIHHYSEDRYIGAALQLFASVALLFWYVLRIFIAMQRD